MASQPQFTLPPQHASFAGFLFDMDGTIVDSTAAIVRQWDNIAANIGVSAATILETSHGRRSIDVLKSIAPDKANWDFIRELEAKIPQLYGNDTTEIPGARALLDALIAQRSPWAIVTSGTEPLVRGWLDVLSLPEPEHLVTAESVPDGKPNPACYLAGLRKLGLHNAAADVLVLEDAPAGIKAAKAAGCKVVGLATTHAVERVVAAGPDWVVKDLESVRVIGQLHGRVTVQITNALRP